MSVLTSITALEIYLEFRQLPPACRPAWVTRHDGAIMLTIDPRTSKFDALQFVTDNLDPAERQAYRLAWGGPPIGECAPETWTSDDPVEDVVPPALQLQLDLPVRTADLMMNFGL